MKIGNLGCKVLTNGLNIHYCLSEDSKKKEKSRFSIEVKLLAEKRKELRYYFIKRFQTESSTVRLTKGEAIGKDNLKV